MTFQLTIDDIVNSNLLETKDNKITINDNGDLSSEDMKKLNRWNIYTSIVSKRKTLFKLEDFDNTIQKIWDDQLWIFFDETRRNPLNKILLDTYNLKGLNSFVWFTEYRDHIKYKILEKMVPKSSEPEEIIRSEKLIRDLKNLLVNKKVEGKEKDDDKRFKFFSSVVNNFTKNFIRDTKVNMVFSISGFWIETESIANKWVWDGTENLIEENEWLWIPRELIGIKINWVSPYKIIELAIRKVDFHFLLDNLKTEDELVKIFTFNNDLRYVNNKFNLITFYTDWFIPFVRKLKKKKTENFCYVCKDIEMFLSPPVIKPWKKKELEEDEDILEKLDEISI